MTIIIIEIAVILVFIISALVVALIKDLKKF